MDKVEESANDDRNRFWGPARTVFALLVAPGLGTASWMVILGWFMQAGDPDPLGFWESVYKGFLFGSFFGSLGSLVLGGALYRILQDVGQTGPLAYMATYPLVALFCGVIGGGIFMPDIAMLGLMGAMAVLAAPSGCFAGLYFWLIRRPDRIAVETRS